jgi:hypothetical protein
MLLRPIAWTAHCVGADKTGKSWKDSIIVGKHAVFHLHAFLFAFSMHLDESTCPFVALIASVVDASNPMQQDVPEDISCQLEKKPQPRHTFHSE